MGIDSSSIVFIFEIGTVPIRKQRNQLSNNKEMKPKKKDELEVYLTRMKYNSPEYQNSCRNTDNKREKKAYAVHRGKSQRPTSNIFFNPHFLFMAHQIHAQKKSLLKNNQLHTRAKDLSKIS